MDNSHRWRPQDQQYYPQDSPPNPPQNVRYGAAAADSVHNAQGLLAMYPMASATPTNHAVRHIHNMYTTAPPPTYAHPAYYTPRNYPQGNQRPYAEYDQQVRYLSAPQPPANDGGYWSAARDSAVRILADQPPSQYRFPAQQTWNPPQAQISSFQTSPFANQIFQRTAPVTNAYPTPPPVMQTSSSSLAHALGPPLPPLNYQPKAHAPPPPQKTYRPEESRAFFNTFLEQKAKEMNASTQAPPPPALPRTSPVKTPAPKFPIATPVKPPESSPDPLSVIANSSPVPLTPRKRKPIVEIESPSIKRMQIMRAEYVEIPQRSSRPTNTTASITPSPKSTPSVKSSGSTPIPKRPVNLVYVSIPRSPSFTASPYRNGFVTPSMSPRKQDKSKMQETPDDLGGYGEDGFESPLKRRDLTDSVKSSARRTGDRDNRAPLEKFLCLVEDIFEAEDSLPAEVGTVDLPDYFSSLSIDSTLPQLHSVHIRKLTKYIGHITRPNQRIRNTTAGVMSTPRAQGRMRDVDSQILSRLLKTLDRTVKAGEDLDPFRYVAPPPGSAKSSPRKKLAKNKKADSRFSATPRPGSDDLPSQDTDRISVDEDEKEIEAELTYADYEKLEKTLDVARESILAADCCIALLGSDRLTKQLYSEELIISCFNAVKNQLTKIIYPFVETSSGTALELSSNPLLRFVVKDNSSTALGHRKQLSELFQALASVLPRINNLVNMETVAMSDAIIISAVYIAIGPFFVVESGEGETTGKKEKDNVVLRTFGKSAMRGLRLDALALIRSIFANHDSQRSWIIEEILTSLIKLSDTKQKAGQFRLRDGRSIRIVSVLLLQLVQTSAHDVRLKARKIEKNRQNQLALKRQESFSENQAQEPFLDENDHEEIVLYKGGLDAATKAAKTIISFLTLRSGKNKTTKNSNEAEYRAIFDNLIGDLLVVLFWPEWPAAGVLLNLICRYMVSALDDKHTNSQSDSNAAKTIALDHLGVIAAKIRTSTLKFQLKADQETQVRPLESIEDIVNNLDIKALDRLLEAHRGIANHLSKRSSEDQAYDSARELSAALLGQELATALQTLQQWIETPELDDDLNIKDTEKLHAFARKIRGALRDVWKDPPTDVFNTGSQDEVDRIDSLGEQIGTLQTMRSSFNPILTTIVGSLNASVIFMRTKALRALGQIVTSDPTVLSMPVVRRGIESHLLDNSPAVRDAAVELIGKYMIDSPEVAGDYYQKIADRMADTGLSVRKRVIKLLKSFYTVSQDNGRKTDIAVRMVLRMMDEDDTVKELATKTVEELWFPGTSSAPAAGTRGRITSAGQSSLNNKNATLEKVIVIMGTAAQFKDRQSPLEDLLHKIMADKSENEVSVLHTRYSEICETLIDGLVDATDMPGFTVVNCIRTIYLFTSAYPPVLSGANASTLLPYLKNASTSEELATTDYLLKIFRVSIPHMPQTAAKFGSELQSALQPMIIKPSGNGGVQILQEAVSCMCVVVQHLTHDFIRLVNLLKSCNARLQQAVKRPATHSLGQNEVRPLLVLIFIVALLGEHCNFDRLRTENASLAKDLDLISKGSITEHIYGCLLELYEKYPDQQMIRGRTLQCLGFLFRTQPTLMTKERSASIMDAIFESPEEDGKGRLLRIMQEFLVSESEKHSAKLKEASKSKVAKPTNVNMDELVGNTDGFADSGVSSAIVQRYLNQVLEAALSPNSQNQGAAVDVLSFTIKQGLAHPLQSFPVIIALETSPVTSLSSRAAALHAILQGKHASLLNTRYIVSARASFEYQKKSVPDKVVKGYRADPTPVALLQRWYSLVREKRPSRQDFLKSLVKVFQENPEYKSTQDDVEFTRYMAENFASFDYKTQEEVITVIKYLTLVLSTTGMQLLEMISPSHLLKQLHEPLQPIPTQDPVPQPVQTTNSEIAEINTMVADMPPAPPVISPIPVVEEDTLDKLPILRTSVVIAMVMLLKVHLKSVYSLSEEKCNKFVVGKKTAAGDKPATRKSDIPISWDRLPYATSPLLTTEDIKKQKTRFVEIWNEDGVTAEPDDELDFS